MPETTIPEILSEATAQTDLTTQATQCESLINLRRFFTGRAQAVTRLPR